MLLDGISLVKAHGKRLSLTIVNAPDLARAVFERMPDAEIIYRPVFSGNDLKPRTDGGFWNGADWFARLWPAMDSVPATYYQFSNEWLDNAQPVEVVRGFGRFYIELAEECLRHGVRCTMGDFSTGTPGYPTVPSEAHYLPALAPMLDFAEANGLPVNYHAYSPETIGRDDIAALAPYFFMRWETLCADHPRLIVTGGEGANAGRDGDGATFRADTLTLMQQAARLIEASPYRAQFRAVNWWGVNDQLWAGDDWSSIIPEYFDWIANS